jgi:hypothetical protein
VDKVKDSKVVTRAGFAIYNSFRQSKEGNEENVNTKFCVAGSKNKLNSAMSGHPGPSLLLAPSVRTEV